MAIASWPRTSSATCSARSLPAGRHERQLAGKERAEQVADDVLGHEHEREQGHGHHRRPEDALEDVPVEQVHEAALGSAAWTVRIRVSTLKGLSRKCLTPLAAACSRFWLVASPLVPTIGRSGRRWRSATMVARRRMKQRHTT